MIKKNIPNLITAANLFTGAVGIHFATQNEFEIVAFCIVIAAVFDFLDGMLARLLKVHSEIGKQLDSLADMVTFGLLPAFVMFQYLQINEVGLWSYFAFIIAVFSAFRLAKFNIDTRQNEEFLGLPTPANALLIGFLIYWREIEQLNFIFQSTSLIMSSLLLSILLIVELPMIALKFKDLKWRSNAYKYITIIVSIILLGIFQLTAVPFVILFYIFLSVIKFMVQARN